MLLELLPHLGVNLLMENLKQSMNSQKKTFTSELCDIYHDYFGKIDGLMTKFNCVCEITFYIIEKFM